MTVVSEDNEWVDPTTRILVERNATHGDFQKKSEFVQELKAMMRETPNWRDAAIEDYRQEALDHIATKIGRLLFGNPDEADSWRDIAGYATLGCGWEP